jgi:hypothetical protein
MTERRRAEPGWTLEQEDVRKSSCVVRYIARWRASAFRLKIYSSTQTKCGKYTTST